MEVGGVVLFVLVLVALVGGSGISMVGPGGIFLTVALFLLLPLSSAEVAGTASAMFVGTGILGWVVYLRSGELRDPSDRRLAAILCVGSIVGAVVGAWVNVSISRVVYGVLLGGFVVVIGGVIIYREVNSIEPRYVCNTESVGGIVIIGVVGLGIGVVSGTLGVGGPVLAVPVLVVLGVPMLSAVAVAQVQSVWIAGAATVGYLLHGAVVWWLVGVLSVPLLLGVYVGWRVAHRVSARRLKFVLGLVLLVVGGYLIGPSIGISVT